MTVYYRRLAGDIEIREQGELREIEARFVPYGTPTRIDARLVEEFAPGAFRAQMKDPSRVLLALGHQSQGGVVIGRVTELREQPDGLYGKARISRTRDGDDALELVRDGVFDSVSIGFRSGQDVVRGGVTVRKSATLTELAIVPNPAYEGAKVLALRSGACPECGHCTVNGDLSEDGLRSVQDELDDIVRSLKPLPLPPLRGA